MPTLPLEATVTAVPIDTLLVDTVSDTVLVTVELIETPPTLTEVIALEFTVIAETNTLALLASLARSFVNVDMCFFLN
jgi:hypothetical protein